MNNAEGFFSFFPKTIHFVVDFSVKYTGIFTGLLILYLAAKDYWNMLDNSQLTDVSGCFLYLHTHAHAQLFMHGKWLVKEFCVMILSFLSLPLGVWLKLLHWLIGTIQGVHIQRQITVSARFIHCYFSFYFYFWFDANTVTV